MTEMEIYGFRIYNVNKEEAIYFSVLKIVAIHAMATAATLKMSALPATQ